MYRIAEKRELCKNIFLCKIEAPLVAKKALPGQFIILRTDENGERIPLTVSDTDPEKGLVTIIFHVVGKTTAKLSEIPEGGYISDFAGPLGKASELENAKKALIICGGAGCAIAYPQAKALCALGAKADVIAGFRSSDRIILEEEFSAVSKNLYICTDDGSAGFSGFVTEKLSELLSDGAEYDTVFAIGPLPMMKAVCDITREPYIKTIVSMNSIMLDGTGMCGSCRLTVDGKTKFACVDGPEFDGHLVDFSEALRRGRIYRSEEEESYKRHKCRLPGGEE